MKPRNTEKAKEYWKPYFETWKSQGRSEEQIYGVLNFLTGQGEVMFKELAEQMIPGEVEAFNMFTSGYNKAVKEMKQRCDEILREEAEKQI